MKRTLDKQIAVEMRLFYALAGTAIIANTLGYVSNAIFYGLTEETIFTFICAVVMYIATAFGIVSKQPFVPALLILAVCNFIEFPVMYCIYGPARLGYMILGIVGIVLFLGKKWRIFGAGLVIIFDEIIIFLKLTNSKIIFLKTVEESSVAALMDFFIAGVSIAVMIIILLSQYEKQQRELQELTEELKEMVNRDPLTQLFNRRYLTEYIDDKIRIGNCEFAIVLLDIDNFKAINDRYGHVYGDETLQAFADIMKKEICGNGIAARFGGEEFMLVFDYTDKQKIKEILNQIAIDFEQFGLETKKIALSFSGGVEVFQNEDRIIKLFNAADEKLYCAKHRGKNQVIYE